MRSPLRWARRRLDLARQATRRRELESELAADWGRDITLHPAANKGGYDEIYYAGHRRERLAVVRVNSPFRRIHDPVGADDPGIPLGAAERLDREWNAYGRLSEHRLSPIPLWRTHDAIACSWLDWPRASRELTQQRGRIWDVMERIVPAVNHMHDADVMHLDLNLGNVLLEPNGVNLAFIDFEFGPVDWVEHRQQAAFDYLRIIDDSLKPRRGGRLLLAEPERLVDLLERHVPSSAREADMGFSLSKLRRLARQPEFCQQLLTVFPGLQQP